MFILLSPNTTEFTRNFRAERSFCFWDYNVCPSAIIITEYAINMSWTCIILMRKIAWIKDIQPSYTFSRIPMSYVICYFVFVLLRIIRFINQVVSSKYLKFQPWLQEAVSKSGVDPNQVQEVYMGNVCQGGAGQAPARQATLFAGNWISSANILQSPWIVSVVQCEIHKYVSNS